MILSVTHKGLENFYTKGVKKGIQPEHAAKLQVLLGALDAATKASEMNQPGWGFHPLKHWGEDLYAVKVNGNWRITFRFVNGNALEVNYVDYH